MYIKASCEAIGLSSRFRGTMKEEEKNEKATRCIGKLLAESIFKNRPPERGGRKKEKEKKNEKKLVIHFTARISFGTIIIIKDICV